MGNIFINCLAGLHLTVHFQNNNKMNLTVIIRTLFNNYSVSRHDGYIIITCVFVVVAGVQKRSVAERPTVEAEPERARADRVAAASQGNGGGGGVRRVRGRGRGRGPAAVREAQDEAAAGPVPEQDALAAPADQGHVGDRPGAHRQGGHVRRGHSVLRDPVPRGRRARDGRAQPAVRRPPAAARPPSAAGSRQLGEHQHRT